MNKKIASFLLPYISPLPFADLVGGLAQTIQVGARAEGDKSIKRFPATNEVALPKKILSVYQDLTPSTQYKSITFIEGYDCKVIDRKRGDINLKSIVRIVGWLNTKELKGITAIDAVIDILSNLPEGQLNAKELTRIQIASTKILDSNIFSKYTFEESARQYLMYPFESFAIELEINFSVPVNPKCL